MKIRFVRRDRTETIELHDSEVAAFMLRIEEDHTIVEVEMPSTTMRID